MRFQVCTIISRNYLAQARVLYRSFRRFHPDVPFTVLVFDAQPGAVEEPFDIALLQHIGLPAGEELRMPILYNVTELATALKPWFFRHLLRRDPSELLYFDPDIEIFSPVDRLAALAHEHCLVVTPHTTRPMSREPVKPNETDILSAGAYNLGFLGLNPDCTSFLDWWSERLLREAVIDVANMRFTDQRWMDFAPGYFDTFILKDETCNVAYWNADSRPLNWNGIRYEVNGQPLCFFHFSGFEPENPHLLSFHQQANPRTRLSQHPALARLCREYTEKLNDAGYAQLRHLPYRWQTAPGGLNITPPMRAAYRIALRAHEETGAPAPPTPFDDSNAFVAWLNEPLNPRQAPQITRYFDAILAVRSDVRAAFPNVPGPDSRAYYDWLRDCGREQIPIPAQLFPSPAGSTRARPNGHIPKRGVTLTGYFRAEAGTGEAGRLMSMALEASGEQHTTQTWTDAPNRQNHPWDDGDWLQHDFDTNLICINADQLPAFGHSVGPEFFRNRYNIGLWFWEAEVFPERMHGAFQFLHEIWVSSEFVRDAIAKVSPVPVFTIPLPLNTAARSATDAAQRPLDLPNRFTFLFCFDFFSVVKRKNPIAVIEAFKIAFANGEGPVLVIKSINGDRNLAELERLYHARGERSDIVIHDGYLSAGGNHRLITSCDCYVSLHRSEGFGLTLAEAMLSEKPAIATRYSGNLQFMTEANSFLCSYDLQPIGEGSDPYPAQARWADAHIPVAAELMQSVYRNPDEASRRGKQAREDVRAAHDANTVGRFIAQRLSELRRNAPTSVAFIRSPGERPIFTESRDNLVREVDVRRTVPPLLIWFVKGPRRAMKEFLRVYDQHLRRRAIRLLDMVRDIDTEWRRERGAFAKRIAAQEGELHLMKQELEEARRRLSAVEAQSQHDQSTQFRLGDGSPGADVGRSASASPEPKIARA